MAERTTRATRSSGRTVRGSSGANKPDLNTIEGARAYAERISQQTGEALPEKPTEKIGNFRKTIGLLNASTAYMSGLVGGAIDPNVGAFEEAAERARLSLAGKEFKGFSDTIRQVYDPEDGAGKVFVATAGFIADVVFDPLTYLTFGMGAGMKVGAKTLTAGATKQFNRVSSKLLSNTERVAEYAKKYGVSEMDAQLKLSKKTEELFDLATKEKGLTPKTVDKFIKLGVERGDIETLQRLGTTLLDKGGVKFMGKTLVTSKQLANTPVGKAAKRLGETETVKAIKAPIDETLQIWKDVLGKMFVPDYIQGKEAMTAKEVGLIKDVQKMIDVGNMRARAAGKELLDELQKDIYKGFNHLELNQFHGIVNEKKMEINVLEKQIREKGIKFIQKRYPELGIKTPEDAIAVLPKLEEFYARKAAPLQKTIDRLSKSILEAGRKEGGELYDGVKKYEEVIQNLKAMIADLGDQSKSIKTTKIMDEVALDVSEEALKKMHIRLVKSEEERLSFIASELEDKLRRIKENPSVGTGVSGTTAKKMSEQEMLVFAQKQLDQYAKELGNAEFMLTKVAFGARKQAKALQKNERLLFDNPKFQRAADKLFEGDTAFVKRLAKMAGIPDDQAMKFYIPSIIKDRIKVSSFAHGQGLSGVNADFRKRFTGSITKNMETNAFKSYGMRGVQVAVARVKSETIDASLRHIGKPMSSMTEKEAAARGYEHFKVKEVLDKNMMSEAWVPKAIYDHLRKFEGAELKTIDKAARAFGFDYATGLMKSYLLLAPAYHIRNITGAAFNMMIVGGMHTLDPRNHVDAVSLMRGKNMDKTIIGKNGISWTLKDIKEQVLKRTDMLDESAFGSAEMLVDEADKLLTKSGRIRDINPLSRQNALLRANMNIGSALDREMKWGMIIGELKEGKTIDAAIESTKDALFNYGKLTEFERAVMRRLIPFYTFARKNAELQIKTLATSPGVIANQVKGIGAAGEAIGDPISQEDMEGLPQFVLDSFGIKGGSHFTNEYGQPTYFTGFGLPIEEFLGHFKGDNGIVRNAIADILTISNPIIKAPLESTLNQDFFRGRPITELDNASSAKWMVDVMDFMSPKVAEQFKDFINWREVPNVPVYENGVIVGRKTRYEADPFALHFMRNMFTSRIQSQVGMLTTDESNGLQTFIRLFTGVKGWTIDQAEQQYYNNMQEKEDLINWMDDMGVNIGTMEVNYLKQ
jgi:hypothetical protein